MRQGWVLVTYRVRIAAKELMSVLRWLDYEAPNETSSIVPGETLDLIMAEPRWCPMANAVPPAIPSAL
jgi:hypothetical protein